MEGAKDVADRRHVDPFVAMQAEQMLIRARLVLPVYNEVASSDSQHREKSENDISPEEELSLFLE